MPRESIYIQVTVLQPSNAVELTDKEMRAIPCHFLLCREAVQRMLVIEYEPGSQLATRETVIAVHLKAYRRKHTVLTYQVFDTLPELTA